MSMLTHSNNINFEVCHRVLSQSVYALLSLFQAMLNMSTLSTNDQGKCHSFWELVYVSVNQGLAHHRRWHQLWRSPFPVTLQRIFNTRLQKLSLVFFCCNFWTLQQKSMIKSVVAKNMVSHKCALLIGPPCTLEATVSLLSMTFLTPENSFAWYLTLCLGIRLFVNRSLSLT